MIKDVGVRGKWINWRKLWRTIGIIVGSVIGAGLVIFIFWYALWVTDVDNYELGFSFDRQSGKIERIDRTGWVIRTPFRYSVHKLDLRPHQLTISANQRVLNAKLVKFNPAGLATFVEWHGRSAGDELSNLLEILKCYAFDKADGKDCPFLEVVQEIAPNQGAQSSSDTIHIGSGK
jgi:hypothetical protein